MNDLEVKEIRKILVEELSKYEGEPILLPLEESILSKIIFEESYGYKRLLKK